MKMLRRSNLEKEEQRDDFDNRDLFFLHSERHNFWLRKKNKFSSQNVQEPSCHDRVQRIPKQKGQVLAVIHQILEGWAQKFEFHTQLLKYVLTIFAGSEDIRANEGREDYHRTGFSIYDEPSTANGRITAPGYRYLPVHRETYGYSPRAIYQHQTQRPG